jgi:hypothetical protein
MKHTMAYTVLLLAALAFPFCSKVDAGEIVTCAPVNGGSLEGLTVSVGSNGIVAGKDTKSGWEDMDAPTMPVAGLGSVALQGVTFWVNDSGKNWLTFSVAHVLVDNAEVLATAGIEQDPGEPGKNRPYIIINWSRKFVFRLNALDSCYLMSVSIPPSLPIGLLAIPGNRQITLSWASSNGASTYDVFRGTTLGKEGDIPYATQITTSSYTDTDVSNDTVYCYRVRAVNDGGPSALSAEANATPGMTSLISLLKDADPDTRLSAVNALVMFKNVEALNAIASVAGDHDSRIASLVAFTLADRNDLRAVVPLIATLKDPDGAVRLKAVTALGSLADKRATRPLISAASDSDSAVRQASIVSLGKLKDKDSTLSLIKLLHDADPTVRVLSVTALGQIKDVRAERPIAYALKSDGDKSVRSESVLALQSITGKPFATYRQWEIYINQTSPVGSTKPATDSPSQKKRRAQAM